MSSPQPSGQGEYVIRSRHLDDKLSVACIYGALRAMRDAGMRPAQETHILIANYEEVGHGGASGWTKPLRELLAVDMAALGEGQTSTKYHCTIWSATKRNGCNAKSLFHSRASESHPY